MRIIAKFIRQGVHDGSYCDCCGLEIEQPGTFHSTVFRDVANTRWIVLCNLCTPVKTIDGARQRNYNLVLRPRAA